MLLLRNIDDKKQQEHELALLSADRMRHRKCLFFCCFDLCWFSHQKILITSFSDVFRIRELILEKERLTKLKHCYMEQMR